MVERNAPATRPGNESGVATRILHVPGAHLPMWNAGKQAPGAGVDQIIANIRSVPEEGDIRRIRNQPENLVPLSLETGGRKDRRGHRSAALPLVPAKTVS